jgi:chloramphenicol 3-O-phosphotransferase
MKLIFLYGPAAAGKLTVGKALQQMTGSLLFHNHLVVDTLLAVFQFGTPSFVRLREQTWLSVFEAAANDDISLIYTFAPENTVNPRFIESAITTVQKEGGEICFVELTCPIDVLEQRVEDPSRAQFLKLRSVQTFRELRRMGADHFPPIPSDLSIDTSAVDPAEAARRICERFHLQILKEATVIQHYPQP